jgi:hypothetical protein
VTDTGIGIEEQMGKLFQEFSQGSSVRKRLTDIGQEIFPRDKQTPETLYAFHKAETEKWWPIIKAAGIKSGIMLPFG